MNEAQIIEHVDQAAEAVKDVVPEVFDAVETISEETSEVVEVVRNNPVILVGVALVAGSIGAFVGYKVAEKRLSTKFDKLLAEELEKTKEHYSAITKTGDYETPESTAAILISEEEREEFTKISSEYEQESNEFAGVSVQEKSKTLDSDGDEVEVTKTRNIFVDGRPIEEFDYEAEEENRSGDHPYVISMEEFFENEPDHIQFSMVYYEGDGVLTDDSDEIVEHVSEYIGEENLTRFGYGSKDRNMVYIRNEKTNADYEIARSAGHYVTEVLGMDEEPEQRVKNRKFRGDDD